MSTPNPFAKYVTPSLDAGEDNPFAKYVQPSAPPAPPKRSLIEAINDNVIEAGNAAAGTASAVANFVRPGNAVSQYIDKNIIEAGNAKQSDVVKAEKARYAQEMEQAQGFGDEVSATLGYVARNPLLAAAQAAGSFAGPGLAVGGARAAAGALGMVGKAATRTGLAAGAGFGMASAGGDAAGTAYELSRQGGATDEQALAAARGASVIPAAIGAAGGLVGAERLVAGAKGFTGGLAARALKTGAVEGAQEALEEGVTQYEGQRAAVPFNPDLDPTKGVAGAATMGAVLGGMTGGGTSLLTRQNQPARKPSEDLGLNPDSGPISRVAADAVDAGRAAVPMQPAQPEDGLSLAPEEQAQPQGPTLEERLAALPEQARAQAEQLLREIADERVPAGVKRFRAHELQQLLDAYPVPESADTITPEERAAIGPIVRGYDPATGEAPGRPLELEGERYQDGIDFTTDEQPSQSAYQEAINRIALESYQTPGQPLAMEQASRLRDAAQEQGIPATIVPHPSGRGFDVQATAVLPEAARQQVAQDPVAAALPYDNSPTGRMVADAQGNARPELRPEAVEREVRWNQELAQMDAEARRRAELGLSNRTPVTPLQEDAAPQQPQSPGPLATQGGRQPVAKQQPQDVQFQASTGRDVAMRNVPGVENAPIDVQATEVRDSALGMTRRLSYGGDGRSLEQGQGAAAQPGPGRAGTRQQTPPALPGPSNLRERIEAFRQKQAEAARMAQQVGQAQQNSAQPAQAAQQPAATDADLDAMFDEAVAAKKQADAQTASKDKPGVKLRRGDWVSYPLDADGNRATGEVAAVRGDKLTVITDDGARVTVNRADAQYVSKVSGAQAAAKKAKPAKTEAAKASPMVFEQGGREWIAEAIAGKGLIKGKFLPALNGETVAGGPFATQDEAIAHAKSYATLVLEREALAARDADRTARLLDKVKAGESLNKADLEFLGLRDGYSDMRWFIPNAARLFGITSRQVRPYVKEMVRISHSDMGVERESVPTNKALQKIAESLAGKAPAEPNPLEHTPKQYADARKAEKEEAAARKAQRAEAKARQQAQDGNGATFSRSTSTKAAYDARIDALFAGEKPALDGVRVLDSSDMLGLLGMGNGPVHLAEGKVNASKHPNMTAQEWKKIPQWLDNPAAVFDSATVSGRLVLVAPETVNNAPVLMVVEPNGQKKTDGVRVHLLQNAYDKDESAPPFGRWLQNGKGRYVNQKEFPAVLNASGLQLSSTAWQNKPGMRRILERVMNFAEGGASCR